MDTVRISFELPRDAFSALREEPGAFVREMHLAAAVKWYEMQLISQAKAAEIAGISRAEFIYSLARFGVSPFQVDADEVIREVSDG